MADCNEVKQMDITVLADTVGSGGVQPMDMLVGEAFEKGHIIAHSPGLLYTNHPEELLFQLNKFFCCFQKRSC